MSSQLETLQRLARLLTEGEDIDVELFFTPDFVVDQPGRPLLSGYAGAEEMVRLLRALGARVQLRILDSVEQNDRVVIRWQVTVDGREPKTAAMLAIYRFVDGRIAEDWGLAAAAPWREPAMRP